MQGWNGAPGQNGPPLETRDNLNNIKKKIVSPSHIFEEITKQMSERKMNIFNGSLDFHEI